MRKPAPALGGIQLTDQSCRRRRSQALREGQRRLVPAGTFQIKSGKLLAGGSTPLPILRRLSLTPSPFRSHPTRSVRFHRHGTRQGRRSSPCLLGNRRSRGASLVPAPSYPRVTHLLHPPDLLLFSRLASQSWLRISARLALISSLDTAPLDTAPLDTASLDTASPLTLLLQLLTARSDPPAARLRIVCA